MKRKYTRKIKPQLSPEITESDGFNDLPLSLRKEIEHIIEYRKRLGLFDDTVERRERAVRYYIWRNKCP